MYTARQDHKLQNGWVFLFPILPGSGAPLPYASNRIGAPKKIFQAWVPLRWLGFKREDIELWFKQAGLKNVKVDCVDEECCADSVESEESGNVSLFVAHGEKS